MTRENYAAFCFARSFSCGNHIVAGMTFEKRVDELLIHKEFKEKRNETENNENQSDNGVNEFVDKYACNCTGNGEGDKSHKCLAVNLEFFNLNVIAIFFHFFCHQFLSLEFFG